MNQFPHEFAIGDVYLSPLLVSTMFGFVAATVTAKLLNQYRLSKYFFYPPLVYVALLFIYTILISTFIIKG